MSQYSGAPQHAQTQVFNKMHDYFIGPLLAPQGLYSSIRSAYHKSKHQSLAVKIISKKALSGIPQKERILFNETVLAPLLGHPNLMTPEEIVENDSRLFQFMPFAEKGDLLHLMRTTPMDKKTLIKFADQLICAIEKLHSFGIVHRDIKLENILISGNGTLKLGDFGLCSITSDGVMTDNCGSFEYAAPEAIHSQSFDGFKADMWGIGVVIYALFQKRLPFEKVKLDYNYCVESLDFSRIPDPYKEICQQLLSLDPTKRPSCDQIRAKLGCKNPQPVLSAIQNSSKEVDIATLSKLSQTIGLPVAEVRADLMSGEFSELKVLSVLMQQRSLIFLPASKAVTAPMQKPHALYSKKFKADSCDIVQCIKNYLLPLRCTLSSPLSHSPEIVLNGKHEDKRIAFLLSDDEEGNCSVEINPDDNSQDMCRSVLRHLEKAFSVVSV